MTALPFVLADVFRAEQFTLIGGTKGLFRNYSCWVDASGIAWAGKRVGGLWFAVTWLGSGWVFDEYARGVWSNRYDEQRHIMGNADVGTHARELEQAVFRLRLGHIAERILWTTHRKVLEQKTSVAIVADFEFASAAWGHKHEDWPRHWRSVIRTTLEGLSWLHVGECVGDGLPAAGSCSSLFIHSADLRRESVDTCPDYCPGLHGPTHHHYLVNVGRGFLGVLEQFSNPDDGSGVRSYNFPIGTARSEGPTLWRTGKSGRLTSLYLPAKLGYAEPGAALTTRQNRLLQALVRETTRKRRKQRRSPIEPEIVVGNQVLDARGREVINCPFLDGTEKYVTFGGNKKRRGLGYLLSSPGGWLSRAGYDRNDLAAFLEDIAALAGPLGLVVVGLDPRSNQWWRLAQLRTMTSTASGRRALARIHLRVYASDSYVDDWNRHFGWSGSPTEAARPLEDQAVVVAGLLERHGLTQAALAEGIGGDPSFVSKILRGRRRCPDGFQRDAQEWVTAQMRLRYGGTATVNVTSPAEAAMLEWALAYLRLGWSIVPQLAGEKKPCVRWKPYQERRPTEEELRDWFGRWPHAGMAVVLGPVGGLFVVDVDGTEAHDVLVERLGGVPFAPQVISGSRKPNRYHLFFRCPAVRTKAKATPWHPKLEFRGQGGIVVIPPSLHPSGNAYCWAEGRTLDDLPLADLPDEIVQSLVAATRRAALSPPPAHPVGVPAVDVSPSTRGFLSGMVANGPHWNGRLFSAACDLAGRGMPREQAEPLLLAGAQPWNLQESEVARRTIESAYSEPRAPGRR